LRWGSRSSRGRPKRAWTSSGQGTWGSETPRRRAPSRPSSPAFLSSRSPDEEAIALSRLDLHNPLDVLAKVGGLEIAGLVGVILGAAAHRVPILLDGFISTAAALVAAALTVTEAKARTLRELGIQVPEGGPATGTSTGALVVGCTGRGETLRYTGPVTEVGWLIGRSVRAALLEGGRCPKRSSC